MSSKQLLLGIKRSISLIQAILKNLSHNLGPIHNRELDRFQVVDTLGLEAFNVEILVDDFVVMHCDFEMHNHKLAYEFLGLYEVIYILIGGRFQLKKIGSNIVTKVAKKQLRLWPVN